VDRIKNILNRFDLIDITFISILIIYIFLSIILLINIPYTFPFGGPDELMHISMAKYISKHLSWPHWDSKELIRNSYGVSYSTGSAIVYWLHGLSYKLFGHQRVGSFLLLLIYLFLTTIIYKKNRLGAFFLLASLFPQTLFIFSYVNSDGGTVVSALALGLSIGIFINNTNYKYFMLVLFFAAFALTARQHLWVIAFLAFVWVIIYKYKDIIKFKKSYILIALLISLIPASWWFITSYFANDGDIIGAFTNAKSILQFSKEGLPSLGRDWEHFNILTFILSTLISIYANWGWLSIALDDNEYIFIAISVIIITFFIYKLFDKKLFAFFIFLIITNFLFMIIYSIFYDYQPQGRYLFPSIYIVVGIIVGTFVTKRVYNKNLLYLLIIFVIINIYFSFKLLFTGYIFLDKPIKTNYNNIALYENKTLHLDTLKIVDKRLFVRGWIFNEKNGQIFKTLYLVLKKDNKFYKIELEHREREDVAKAFKSKNIINSGFYRGMIDVKSLEKGIYKCYIFTIINNKPVLIDTKKSLKI